MTPGWIFPDCLATTFSELETYAIYARAAQLIHFNFNLDSFQQIWKQDNLIKIKQLLWRIPLLRLFLLKKHLFIPICVSIELYLKFKKIQSERLIFSSSVNAWYFQSQWIIMLNNRDLSIDQNNRDYDFCHNPAALVSAAYRQCVRVQLLSNISACVVVSVHSSVCVCV